MSTYATAEDQYVTVQGIKYAYRRFGITVGIPLFLHMHFRGTMDHWDPAFINPLAARRPILLIDSSGVGRSEGDIQTTFAGWAQVIIDVFNALNIKQIDLFGFSMGGCAAQMIALNAPNLVRKLILAGTIPSVGEGVVLRVAEEPFFKLRTAVTREEQLEAFLLSFFESSQTSQAAGRASFERIHSSRPDRVDYVSVNRAKKQGIASMNFRDPKKAEQGSYDRLHELRMPVLVANGSNDVLLPTENSYIIWKRLVNADAHLHLYPNSGHGFLYQYADHFTTLINDFLDTPSSRHSRL